MGNKLYSGIFWIITENNTLNDYQLLAFTIPCDANGYVTEMPTIPMNAKSGNTYNHKQIWESEIKKNSVHRPYNKKYYDYFPRGRVEVSNNRATIYINPNINETGIINRLKQEFGLSENNIANIRTVVDGSAHYQCFMDSII